MLISQWDWAWGALLDAGVRVEPAPYLHGDVVLWLDGDDSSRTTFNVKSFVRTSALGAAEIRRLSSAALLKSERLLILAESVSEHAQSELRMFGWSWITRGDGEVTGSIRLMDRTVDLGEPRVAPKPSRPGRTGYGEFAVIRALLTNGAPQSQKELATRAKVTQPRVSQILKDLREDGLIDRIGHGAWRASWDGLLEHFLEIYSGPGGVPTYWFGLNPVVEQTVQALHLLEGRAAQQKDDVGPRPIASGDPAADAFAPWRRPVRAVIYAATGGDLSDVGLTPSGKDEATLELITPKDKSVWMQWSSQLPAPQIAGQPVANGIQVLWDVRRGGGPDADQATSELIRVLRDRFAQEFALS